MLSGFHHVKLPVSDVARSRDWYTRVLGFTTDIEFVEDGVLMGVGLARDGMPAGIALRHDPERAKALAGFDARRPARADPRATCTPGGPGSTRRASRTAGSSPGHRGGAVLVGLHDPDGIEIRLYAD